MSLLGTPSQPIRRLRSRRRRRKAAPSANKYSASRQADLATPPTRPANENAACWASSRATRLRSAANDLPGIESTPMKHPHSFTSSPLSQLPIPAANQNSGSSSHQEHPEIWGLYKPALTDPRQKENTHLIYDIKTLLLQHKTAGRKVTLNWIPSHIGIPGNDKADELAGTTKHIDRVQITMPLSILTIKNTLKQTNRTNIEKEVTHWANNNSRSAQWYTKATKFELPPIYRDTPRHLAVTIHRLRLGYKANWEIDEPIIRPCEHCQTQTEYPLLHYLLQCPNTQSLRPHMQALDPANPEANRIAAGQVKDIMDNIETHIQTLTDFPPPR